MEPFVEDFLAWEVPAAAATVPQAPTMAEKVALSFSFSAAATNRFRVLVVQFAVHNSVFGSLGSWVSSLDKSKTLLSSMHLNFQMSPPLVAVDY